MDMPNTCIGFLGCGKISSAVARGYAGAPEHLRPKRIIVSPRSADKALALKEEFPDVVEIAVSNDEVVAQSSIVFIGLLPGVAAEVLPLMPFRADHVVISMMAAVNYEDVLKQAGTAEAMTVKTVPLPSNAMRSGPILMHPPNQRAHDILSIVGTPVPCVLESEMKPMICLTGHISTFFELQRVTQEWMMSNGIVLTCSFDSVIPNIDVPTDTARLFVTQFYLSLAQAAANSHHTLGGACHIHLIYLCNLAC